MQKIRIMIQVLIGLLITNLKKSFFYFLQDSVIFKKNLSNYEKNDLTTFRYFLSFDKIGVERWKKQERTFKKESMICLKEKLN